ncbi:ATP-binding cassette domain-containing protein [Dactylosporangium aurantiacum]|uniref:ATP-binding cassette domain-containing protein n=1 Tax=Dactylosporangium aurantiacum TaxID=35754 RepID=A0A9Q9IKR8_9ACTN|nr:ATP-binding cassette domain-containing protein [Dactylosporangium aurantiacum]MDG6105865.1 ATP-binding cassette domain-containing protein [Dactylosporangium aurantiacum]UWZ57959.1 ATP-binding cassette domain-containing protein [Dactylosporangium aurantiacum]
MVRAVSDEETAPTTYAWPVHAQGLRLTAGRRAAVDGLDLALGNGVHGLLGPNGAGKTTLIRALATVLRPAAGRLELLGRPVQDGGDLRPVRRALGYLPQDFGYYRWFTVREFVEHVAWLKEMPARAVPDAVQRAIDRVELTGRAGSRLRSLSGGMLRRVGIAQAIVSDPALLLLDEPTAGLDPEQRMGVRALLRDLGRDSCVVVATHLVDDVAAACTGVVLLDGGRLVLQGAPGDLEAAAGADDGGGGDGGGGARGGDGGGGGSTAERGYAALLRRHRAHGGRS